MDSSRESMDRRLGKSDKIANFEFSELFLESDDSDPMIPTLAI